MYIIYLQNLPSSYHVIVVDLPGHGDSSIPAEADDVSMSLILDSFREVRNAITCVYMYLSYCYSLVARSTGIRWCRIYTSLFTIRGRQIEKRKQCRSLTQPSGPVTLSFCIVFFTFSGGWGPSVLRITFFARYPPSDRYRR